MKRQDLHEGLIIMDNKSNLIKVEVTDDMRMAGAAVLEAHIHVQAGIIFEALAEHVFHEMLRSHPLYKI